jgi:hypothetical protein
LSESTFAAIGIATASSQLSRTAWEIPSPSLPKTRQQSPVKFACESVLPLARGCAAMQRMLRDRKSRKTSASVGDFSAGGIPRLLNSPCDSCGPRLCFNSTTGNPKIAPIEFLTARRRNGLLEVSPTINPWTPNATQLRTSAPRFSAFDNSSIATNNFGAGLFCRMSSSEAGGGI